MLRLSRWALLAALVYVLAAGGPALAVGPEPQQSEARSGYIVVFRDDVDGQRETDLLERFEGFRSDFRYGTVLKGFAAKLTARQAARLQRHPAVAIVSVDGIVHAIGAVTPGETVPTGIRRAEASDGASVAGASTVNVAVIDTGVDLTHPDLNAVSGTNCVTPGTPANDDNGHGSHVAGTIAAKNTGAGVVGVAPGTTIYAVKVLNAAGSGTWSQIICGIDWVTANSAALNIKVANMSLGGSGTTNYTCGESALHQAVCNSTAKGVSYVVAAGNSNQDFFFSVPANYTEVLTVTAMSDSDGRAGAQGGAPTCRAGEKDDSFATFSNFADPGFPSDTAHTISGPGVCIRSTWMNGGYSTISGTSMASPHLAGVVALCFGSGGVSGACADLKRPDGTSDTGAIINKLRSDASSYNTSNTGYGFTGDPLRPVAGKYYGHLVSAKGYLSLTPDTTAPVISAVAAGGITASGATITWTTDEASDSQVGYRTGAATTYTFTTPSQTAGVTSHSVALSGLSASTTYFYVARSKDAAGNLATSAEQSFTTATPDTTAPVISAVAAGGITASGATITWTTDEASDSQIGYRSGAATTYTFTTPSQTTGVTSHSVALSGLSASTTYFYVARSKDAAGNLATSAEQSFTTTASTDTTAPTISNVKVADRTDTTARITWTTNEPATSQVEYGTTTAYGQLSPLSATRVTNHSVTLTGLEPETVYHYRVLSRDAAGNLARSADRTFETDPVGGD